MDRRAMIRRDRSPIRSAQLAAIYPQLGGTYEYGYQVLHPWLGFAADWMFLASKLAVGGTVALGFAGYLSALIPGIPERPVAIAAALLFFAYTGYARLATLGEGVHEPRKTIPRAIILALGIAAILYAAVAAVAVGNIGAEGMAASHSPIESAAGAFRWPQVR